MPDPDTVSLYITLHPTIVIELAASVICFYDHIFTFSQEVTYVWNRRFSAITAVFVLNRYVVMSDRIVRLFQFKSWDGVSAADANRLCNIGWRWSEASTIVMYLCIAGFSALQAYAVYGKDKRVFSFVTAMGAINPILNIYYSTTLSVKANPAPFTGCDEDMALGDGPNLYFLVCGVVAAFVSKVVVLALIWRRLAGDLSVLRRLKIKTSCAALLWRDGTIYLVVLMVVTTLSLISVSNSMKGVRNVSTLTDTMACMCLSRYILHLRATAFAGAAPSTSLHLSRMSDLRFAQPEGGSRGRLTLLLADPEVDGLQRSLVCDDSDDGIIPIRDTSSSS